MAREVHQCVFEQIDTPSLGVNVLMPCECGETPLDELMRLQSQVDELNQAMIDQRPNQPLFHWSPVSRRKSITHSGLLPWKKTTTSTGSAAGETFPVLCFADSPSWAWALSAEMPWAPRGEWDLWQTSMDCLVDPIILASNQRQSGIYEVRTITRVWKRDLLRIGSRSNEERMS